MFGRGKYGFDGIKEEPRTKKCIWYYYYAPTVWINVDNIIENDAHVKSNDNK